MKAMLLAAGLGERLRPLSAVVPKPIVPVLGRPMASMILHRLATEGISSAVVNLFHHGELIRATLGDGSDLGLDELHYSAEERLLGTAGGVRRAAGHLRGGGTLLVRNSDFLADIDLTDVTAAHLASGCLVTLVLCAHRAPYTPVAVSADGRVLSFGGRPPFDAGKAVGQYLFTGMQLMDEELLDRIPEDRPSDLVRDLYVELAAQGEVSAFIHPGFWWEFGTPSEYLEGSLALLRMDANQRARVAKTDPVEEIGGARVAVGTGADFHQGVELRGTCAIGFASLVAEGCVLEDSVVMPEAWIGPGVKLLRCIVASGAEVPAGFEAANALVAPDLDPDDALPPETERMHGLLVRRIAATRRVRV